MLNKIAFVSGNNSCSFSSNSSSNSNSYSVFLFSLIVIITSEGILLYSPSSNCSNISYPALLCSRNIFLAIYSRNVFKV